MRKIKFANDEYYHIYNRGVDRRDIFLDEGDYLRFLTSMREFNNNSTHDQRVYIKNRNLKDRTELSSEASELSSVITSLPNLVDIICYCFNPNHFHLLLKQLADKGIEKFMHKLGSGYTNFFNIKYKRAGSLFQGPFKAVKIVSTEHLLWVSAYVNANAQIHGLTKDAANYKWCSYSEYLGQSPENFCQKDIISKQFKDKEQFKGFMNDCIITMKEKKELQKYLID